MFFTLPRIKFVPLMFARARFNTMKMFKTWWNWVCHSCYRRTNFVERKAKFWPFDSSLDSSTVRLFNPRQFDISSFWQFDISTFRPFNSVQLFDSSTLRLFDSWKLRQFNSSTLWLFDSSTVWFFDSSTFQLFNSSTFRLFNISNLWKFDTSTLRLFDSSKLWQFDRSTPTFRNSPFIYSLIDPRGNTVDTDLTVDSIDEIRAGVKTLSIPLLAHWP